MKDNKNDFLKITIISKKDNQAGTDNYLFGLREKDVKNYPLWKKN